ncbi:MAG: uroporphyrinogen decarboxylase family protein [Desulforhopalus sp.]
MNKGKKTMSRRERVVTALEHREPDRVPISMSITINAYNNLKKYMGIELEENLNPGRWTEVPIHPDVAEKFGQDVIWLPAGKPHKKPKQSSDPNKWFDSWGVEWTKIPLLTGGYYNEMTDAPLKDASIKDLEDFDWPDPYDPGVVEGVREYYRQIHNETDFAILTKFGGAVFEQAWYLRGMEKFMMDLAMDPEFVEALLKKIYKVQLGLDGVLIEAAGEYVDILRLSGEDMGSQENPLISLPMFRQMVRPHLEKLWGYAKEKLQAKNPKAKIMLHSCGAIKPFIPDWIDMGLDVLDPIQPRAKGMDPFGLKADFGDKLTFHGGIDAQHFLPFGTEEEVRQETRKYIQALAPGGGYICAPVHNVQGDVPPENLIAMRDAVEEFGYYPIIV